ncbi:MAG: Sensor histidine kinase, HAMP domain-containing [Candidatus Adlerbacteria bacterium GW2011_GWA1_54_10]|uniref:histidine kinase n=2 Tax=Candidatus Adleribacteriota TaxID=1752736 RepID=A0A0G2A3R2_9BACT|nr:MAG: Sensor histidine kinase, HAMP domain-containing [Candidatus Adlerbacteria bacterium GW2011_GWA1_54_10]KKW38093.1 MAG: Sensor histidine kinase, HAMP domain-containing [Candidatus Adlerbacteria bacterium GW2011_GWB1_54_7]
MRRYAASVIALWAKYASKYREDLFFRTSVNIIALQVGFVLLTLAALFLALIFTRQSWLIFGAIIAAAALFGFIVTRAILKPAHETLRYQKRFISDVAHELRTPLSTIKTSSEVALIDEKLPRSTRKIFLETIEELGRVSEIINNLLSLENLTRPERMQFKSVDLAPLAEAVVKRNLPLARERSIRISMRKETGCVVWGNGAALEQIMDNLVKNALYYTPKGAQGTALVELRPSEDMVLFSVTDTGIGMSRDDLSHIFEPFYRADISRVRKVKKAGSGLGLTIVSEMVRAHGGKIRIQSQKRKGTEVSVYLPMGGAARHARSSAGIADSRIGGRTYSEASIDFTGEHPHAAKINDSRFTFGSVQMR